MEQTATESTGDTPSVDPWAPESIEAVVMPTRVVHPRRQKVPHPLRRRLATLDALLHDTAQDLGLVVDLTGPEPAAPLDETSLPELAQEHGKLAILPMLRVYFDDDQPMAELRIVAASPAMRTLRSRVERVRLADLNLRAVVMLRDVVSDLAPSPSRLPHTYAKDAPVVTEPSYGAGRAILAANGTLFGGFLGYSLQRASGSDDPRLLYPLLGLGAGAGLGAAILVADEWRVTDAEAWYLAAGVWWPTVGAHLIYEGRFGEVESISEDEAWSVGMIASGTGLTLAVIGLLSRPMGDGGAVLSHSGGGLGLITGALVEMAVSGTTEEVPLAGMGYGAAGGWMLASAAATLFEPSPDQMLVIDLGVALGGLGGAAAASPLLFEDPTADETRGWVAATGAGMIAGGVLAWLITDGDDEPEESVEEPVAGPRSQPEDIVYRWTVPAPALIVPRAGRGAAALLDSERMSPALGAQWQGVLW